jgi:integrase
LGYFKLKIIIPATVTKSGDPGFALLNSQAYTMLKQMERERDKNCDWVFPSKTSESGHLTSIRRTFRRICKNAGVRNFTTHDMRRAYASTLINANVPLEQIKELLNHKDIRTTLVYARLNTASLQNANEIAGKALEKHMG